MGFTNTKRLKYVAADPEKGLTAAELLIVAKRAETLEFDLDETIVYLHVSGAQTRNAAIELIQEEEL